MLVFRKATEKDIIKVSEIYEYVHTCTENGDLNTGWVRNVYPTYHTAQTAFERGDLFVAEDEGNIVGTAIINQIQMEEYRYAKWKYDAPDNEVMVLHTLAILPSASGNGYGKEFVKFYEEYALSQNCVYLRMDTNVINSAARAMYKKLGFWETGIVDCIFNGISDVGLVLLEKKLK